MLKKIHFNDEDTLYILGDVIDRGNQSIELLKDMSLRSNIYPILGNHELMALEVLRKLNVEITEANYNNYLDEDFMQAIIDWQINGGEKTLTDFAKLSPEERQDLLDYMQDFSLYEVIDVGTSTFILVHAGLGNYSPQKKLSDYSIGELIWSRQDRDICYFDDPSIFVVAGHTPTFAMAG